MCSILSMPSFMPYNFSFILKLKKCIIRKVQAHTLHEVIALYTPQHNGVTERKNRSVLNLTRRKLKAKNMPKIFWVKEASTTMYIMNRCSTKKMFKRKLHEAWTGSKPNISHLRVFWINVFQACT